MAVMVYLALRVLGTAILVLAIGSAAGPGWGLIALALAVMHGAGHAKVGIENMKKAQLRRRLRSIDRATRTQRCSAEPEANSPPPSHGPSAAGERPENSDLSSDAARSIGRALGSSVLQPGWPGCPKPPSDTE